MISIEKKMGVVKDGKVIIPYKYDHIEPMIVNGEKSEELFKYRDGEKQGVILYDTEYGGYMYRTDSFTIERNFENRVAIVRKDNFAYALLNSDLNYLTQKDYYSIEFANNCYIAKKDDIIDIYDIKGKMLYENVTSAIVDGKKSDKLFITCNNSLFGLFKVDKDKIAEEVAADFTSIDEFKNGVAIVTMQYDFGFRYGLLDINFNEILEPVYDRIYMLDSDLYSVSRKDKYGVYSVSKKKIIIPTEFKAVSFTRTQNGNTLSVSI